MREGTERTLWFKPRERRNLMHGIITKGAHAHRHGRNGHAESMVKPSCAMHGRNLMHTYLQWENIMRIAWKKSSCALHGKNHHAHCMEKIIMRMAWKNHHVHCMEIIIMRIAWKKSSCALHRRIIMRIAGPRDNGPQGHGLAGSAE